MLAYADNGSGGKKVPTHTSRHTCTPLYPTNVKIRYFDYQNRHHPKGVSSLRQRGTQFHRSNTSHASARNHTHKSSYIHTYTPHHTTRTRTQTHTHTRVFTCTNTHIHIHAHHTHIQTDARAHTHTCIRIHAHVSIHEYTNAYTQLYCRTHMCVCVMIRRSGRLTFHMCYTHLNR